MSDGGPFENVPMFSKISDTKKSFPTYRGSRNKEFDIFFEPNVIHFFTLNKGVLLKYVKPIKAYKKIHSV